MRLKVLKERCQKVKKILPKDQIIKPVGGDNEFLGKNEAEKLQLKSDILHFFEKLLIASQVKKSDQNVS